MQIVNNKIILVLIISIFVVQNIYATGKRKNFLSHGPSVVAFSQGETALNSLDDPSVIYHNSSLLGYFDYNNVSLSRYNLFDGTSYNAAAINYRLLDNFFLGFSAIDLASGDVEIRQDAFDNPKTVKTNQWAYVLSAATTIKPIDTSIGINLKYIYYDLYAKKNGGFATDIGLSKYFDNVDIKYTRAKFGVGLSMQNIVGTGIKLDEYKEDFQYIFRLSTLMEIPIIYRLETKDTLTLSLDIVNEDSYNELFAGLEYKFIEKYAVRCGYYPEHITAGFGINISAFTVNYSIDFNELDLINRFSLSYRWNKKKRLKNELEKEAQAALNQDRLSQQQAQEMFDKAKDFYNKKQYLYSTDILQKIIMDYPTYESPNIYFEKIKKMMKEKSSSSFDTDFDEYAYWAGYKNYYEGNYDQCLKEWMKYLQFDNKNKEITEYYNKVNEIVTNSIEEQKKKQFEYEANTLLKNGIILYKNKQWVECIKYMEKLQEFLKKSQYTNTSFNYYSSAKEYIDKSVKEITKSLKNTAKREQKNIQEPQEENILIDEKLADEKYKEGLILYAKGKYFEAEKMFELALRLNPNHQRAINALKHLK
ncbi:tetratricopeptide repeat protein [Candidatus Ruminimicrobiellum ovillum]|uniref:tetratricopeptide repeat protein n=1 Tax=Candidatus Ruminimicrobiellum ovillum TaxID=1947927 RepID=UPI00355A363C